MPPIGCNSASQRGVARFCYGPLVIGGKLPNDFGGVWVDNLYVGFGLGTRLPPGWNLAP